MGCEETSSAGLGGMGPESNKVRFGRSGTPTVAVSSVPEPVSTLVSPCGWSRPKMRPSRGRRRSASTRQVRACWARAVARLRETVVLPSPGEAETVSMTWGGLPARDSMTEVYSVLTASASAECGLSRKYLGCGSTSCFLPFPRSLLAREQGIVKFGIGDGFVLENPIVDHLLVQIPDNALHVVHRLSHHLLSFQRALESGF